MVDDFVLSALVTKTIDGLLHFTENTNLAALPIKFASAPYVATNFPPVLIFSNDFSSALAGLYQHRQHHSGQPQQPQHRHPGLDRHPGPVTVVSNAFFDAAATNSLAMATGAVQCLLPTTPGHRYQLSYNLRGPCAVGWWNGSVEPLSRRAQDLISGNNGAFLNGAASVAPGFVGAQGLSTLSLAAIPAEQDRIPSPDRAGDPQAPVHQRLHHRRLDQAAGLQQRDLLRHGANLLPRLPRAARLRRSGRSVLAGPGTARPIQPASMSTSTSLTPMSARSGRTCVTTNAPVQLGGGSTGAWWHVAAVFDKPFTNVTVPSGGTNLVTVTTNALRLYLNGACVATNYTTLSPYQDLDPAFSPGVTIGNRSRYDGPSPSTVPGRAYRLRPRTDRTRRSPPLPPPAAPAKPTSSLPPAQSLAGTGGCRGRRIARRRVRGQFSVDHSYRGVHRP